MTIASSVRTTLSTAAPAPTAPVVPPATAVVPAVLAPNGLVVFETDVRSEPELPLPVRTSRKYGNTRVTVFEAAT